MNHSTKSKTVTSDRLRELLAENLPRSSRGVAFGPETSLRQLGITSLGLILVFTRFCQEFNIPMETLETNPVSLHTIGDLLAAGERILEQQNGLPGNGSAHG